ncbi:AsmA family protein [Rhizobium sp. TRM96647]|uniref:AsmA family protein n=1 Tax=unclassified Rhizobium TaxID=2613769 RepID=UPI0021E892C7|nr:MULTISPECIES: AsmA-like C-terminal region-containing protein [unclassified Rhizobium]MCV3737086.1 AsmA family protein [Rhizobium sp. TRM96647]MCV3759070.1 AsmA family protein [Rhizobium sp. TRM96650]
MGPLRYLRPKLLLRLLAAMVVLALALRLAGPTLVSSDRIRTEIEANLSAWTGAELEFSGTPRFSFWPAPHMAFEDVRLHYPGATAGDGGELLTAERIAVDFSLLGSLLGAPDLGDVELLRPLFHIRRDEGGRLNWRGSEGIEQAFSSAPKDPATAPLPQFGTLLVREGTIVVDDRRRGQHYRIADVAGKIAWPKPSSDLDVSLRGVIDGEVAEVRFAADEPVRLLNGRDANIRLSVQSDPVKLDFDGTANLSSEAFATGRIELTVPSFSHLLDWTGTRFTPAGRLGAVTLEGNVTTSDHTARIDKLALDIQDSRATGILDISLPPKGTPKLEGTLAFDTVDLAAMIGAYVPVPNDGDTPPPPRALTMDGLDLDLRFSAREAFFEPLVLTEFAAGIRTSGGQTTLDIGDGTVLGGSVSGQVTASDQNRRPGGELQLSLRDVDLGALIALADLSGPLPNGRGSADLDLFTDQPLARLDSTGLVGTFRLRFDQGSLAAFDRPEFERQARGESVFSMTEAADGAFDFASAAVDGRFDRGLAEISRATFEGAEKTLSIAGTIPFRNGNVALAGSLAARKPDGTGATEPAINFLVGGAWPAPVISPMAILMDVPAN